MRPLSRIVLVLAGRTSAHLDHTLRSSTIFIIPVTRDAGLAPDTHPAVKGGQGLHGTTLHLNLVVSERTASADKAIKRCRQASYLQLVSGIKKTGILSLAVVS